MLMGDCVSKVSAFLILGQRLVGCFKLVMDLPVRGDDALYSVCSRHRSRKSQRQLHVVRVI